MRTIEKRIPVAMAGVVILAALVAALLVALGGRSVVAGPDSGPAAAPPNPGHSWSEIGDFPGTMWHSNNDGSGSGLDADTVDGAEAAALEESAEIDTDIASHAGDASAHHTKTTDASEIVSGTMSPDRILGMAWTSTNDGPGSGLDADMVDGLHASEIAGALGRPGFSRDAVDSAYYVGPSTSVTVGADGLPLISYHDSSNGDLKVAHCGNADCSAGNTITTVDSAGDVGYYTSVTVGADGLPLISYHDWDNGDLKVAHCGNAACTAGNTITTVDSGGDVGLYTSVTVGVDGLPVISYRDQTNADLKVAHCGNADCSAGNSITTMDSAGNVGEYTSVTVGADRRALISYFDYTNFDLKVAHCGNAACTAGNTTTTVDSGYVGGYTSVTVGVDGLPVISYYDYTNTDLKVAHCGNAACSAGNTITTVDSAGVVGYYTSVTVGADGLPLISYCDWDNRDLKVAHCSNAACTSSTTTQVDAADAVGAHTSVTVGVDGLPLISYYDTTNQDLKVAHCSNRFCVPYHRPR